MVVLNCPIEGCTYATGDIETAQSIALFTVHGYSHAPGACQQAKPDKLSRPKVSKESTSEDWEYFITRWDAYKTATRIADHDATLQLLECCEDSLRKDLHRSHSNNAMATEIDALTAIKALAVKAENAMVSRMTLLAMTQDREEGVRSFAARLRGQAKICKFSKNCSHNPFEAVNYTDDMVRDALIRGLGDSDIQQDVLGHNDQDMTLEDTIKFIEAKEAGKRSQATLQNPSAATVSSYKQTDKDQHVVKCRNCGKPGHGDGRDTQARKEKCKAWDKICSKCDKMNHFANVFRSKPKRIDGNTTKDEDESNTVFHKMCNTSVACTVISHKTGQQAVVLDHHIFDDRNGWITRRSPPQPTVSLTARAHTKDYEELGYRLHTRTRQVTIAMTADTGCQSVLVGIKIIHRLGFKKSDLIPVKTKMSAVNRDVIPILGAVILRLSGKSGSGKVIETAQICYVTDMIEGAYLSREACTTLGIIPSDFPRIGSATQQPMSVSSAAASPRDEECECSCPIRTKPPPLPTALPFLATDANRTALQNWILDRYRSSTFNTCECQTIPLMEGPPLELHVDPEAKPIAVHKPIPVPLHWQQEVKESIDRDVKRGVLEAAPVGEPVTWCHRMVTAWTKNGKPRRTVDMQVLNKHAVRETHHTQSPFHQATLVPAGTKKTITDA